MGGRVDVKKYYANPYKYQSTTNSDYFIVKLRQMSVIEVQDLGALGSRSLLGN